MEAAGHILLAAQDIYARAEPAADPKDKPNRPPVYKAVGISLAIASGLFIGVSFVLKKVGLLKANVKYHEEAGEGYGYLKNALWWSGMTLMIVGEVCNFVAYAFVDAILVTPLGALSVVVTTILSAMFLNERLSFVGKIGCFMCIIGSVVIVMNAPAESSVNTIGDMKKFVLAPGFLAYAGVIIAVCIFIAFWAGPRYGKRTMLVYISICSLIGGLSVVATQGLGAAVVAQVRGTPQFNQWFLYVLLVFVIATLVTEIIFLNKALNIFNAALVTPTYYVFFTSSTIATSAVLFKGFDGTPTSIITVVMGFLQICSGVILLQLSKSAKNVPDVAVLKGDLDQVRTVAEQEEPESEPKADAIRGAAAIIRRFSNSRQMKEAAEVKRVHEERLKDQMEPIGEDEMVEWQGLRRKKTLRSDGLESRKTAHPPLGLTRFPDDDDDVQDGRPESNRHGDHDDFNGGFMNSFRRRALGTFSRRSARHSSAGSSQARHPTPSMAMTDVRLPIYESEVHSGNNPPPPPPQTDGTMESPHVFGLPQSLHHPGSNGKGMDPSRLSPEPSLHRKYQLSDGSEAAALSRPGSGLGPSPPPHTTKRQFSFQNVFHRRRSDSHAESMHSARPASRVGLGSRSGGGGGLGSDITKSGTEEERLGLVKGDSNAMSPLPDYMSPLPDYNTSEDDENESWLEKKGVLDGHYGERVEEPDKDADEDDTDGKGNGSGKERGDARAGKERSEKETDHELELETQQWILDSGISPARYYNLSASLLVPGTRSGRDSNGSSLEEGSRGGSGGGGEKGGGDKGGDNGGGDKGGDNGGGDKGGGDKGGGGGGGAFI